MTEKEFIRNYQVAYPKVFMVAQAILGNRDDAVEVVQESVMVALKKDSIPLSSEEFTKWFSQIVRNISRNRRRNLKIRSTHSLDGLQIAVKQFSNNLPPSVEDLRHHYIDSLDDQLREALLNLDETVRVCLLLKVVLDLSYEEIASITGEKPATAASHVHRAKKALWEDLNKSGHR